jgi:uncharacterized phage protein gp47/JayE
MTQFTVKPLNDIISDLLLNVFNNVDDVTDGNVGGVLRQMLEAVAQEISLLYESLQLIYDGSRVDTAEGTDLEQIGAIVGVTRKDGTKAAGDVTFIRLTPATADFTIAANSIVSTQPNTGEEQLRFFVTANTTFYASITAELQRFRDGIYKYPLTERILDEITLLEATVGAVPGTPLTEGVDFEIIHNAVAIRVEDATTLVMLDDCETADWTESTDATADVLDNVEFREGSDSIKLGKSGVISTDAYYEKILASTKDGNDADLHVWIYIKDATALSKIDEIKLLYASGGNDNNSYELAFPNADLTTGWQRLRVDRNDDSIVQTGFPSISAINFLRITITTNLVGDTLASGDVNMDMWSFTADNEYDGDYINFIIGGTKPDDDTDIDVDYVPLSREVACEAEAVGQKYDVTKHKIVFKVSSIPNIQSVDNYETMSGGVDIETDTELRERIKDTSLAGAATAEALRVACLAVEGVTSVSVRDLPRQSASSEGHVYSTLQSEYQVDFEIAVDNSTLDVVGTVGAVPGHTFIKNTDYVLDSRSQIVWQGGGTKPDDSTIFYVTYDYDWLGHVEIYVSGVEAPLPASVLADVNTAIEETRAAGVEVTVFEPTIVSVDVTTNIDVESGYDSALVENDVEDNIRDYLNALGVGDDVYVSELIRIIQETPGVQNSTVTVPAADVVIAVTEVAKAGTITVT